MFEQYGENEILTAEAKRESAQLQTELAWDVAQGANETIRVNQSMGLYEQRDYHPQMVNGLHYLSKVRQWI
ncbi:hypothetical protein BSK56_33330 [Paenibacillus borealis]|uniref:Uncharacterized protein n=1 Tax=Paenibacillus borealis TaxID=160799 RepID=A0ABX3GQV9_PAEBO|nr:hypothetical protein [Paenibacillus borealis]OMD35021.1 hypothetical protein BSK56_33330 [Paenibacillus borealis]